MTDQQIKTLARALREDQLAPRTQWLIVAAVWIPVLAAVAGAFFG